MFDTQEANCQYVRHSMFPTVPNLDQTKGNTNAYV